MLATANEARAADATNISGGAGWPILSGALAALLAVAFGALFRQRQLRRRLARQATELAEGKALLATAQEFTRVGHWRHVLFPAGPIAWSDETYRIFERNPAHGPPASLDELLNFAQPADRPTWETAMRRAEEHGVPYDFDLTLEPRPGVRKIVHLLGRPIRDDAGRVTALFGTAQDITQWRETEQALRQSELLLRALFDNLPYALGVLERTGTDCLVVSVNPEAIRLLNTPTPTASELTLSSLALPPERIRFWADLVAQCDRSATVVKTELILEAPHREFAVTIVPLGAAATGRPRFCFLAEDVTAHRQKDAEIAEGRRLQAIGELVGGIAHQFNNLLTPILLKAGLLRSEWSHEPALSEGLQVIADTARRAAELTRRLLTFGRRTEVNPESLAVRTIVENNFNLLRQTVDRRIALENDVPPDLPALWLNGGDLQQILFNLLLNSRDTLVEKLATQPDEKWTPRILVSATALPPTAAKPQNPTKAPLPTQWIRLTCSDNGMGMAPTVIERIFEPFFTTKQDAHATGLGLATVWHLVTEIGGRIEVESTPGNGAAFQVFLPVYPSHAVLLDAPRRPPDASPTSPTRINSPRSHLLVVEDEDAIASLIGQILKRLGYAVTRASDGREGLARLAAAPTDYHALVLDLNLPGITGKELLRRARALPFDGPVIVASGRVTEEDRKELVALRATVIVQKPFTVETFTAALASANLSPHRPL